jgi:arylsulfatase B
VFGFGAARPRPCTGGLDSWPDRRPPGGTPFPVLSPVFQESLSTCLAALSALVPGPHAGGAQGFVPGPDNVLVIVVDDFGVDQLAAYGEGTDPPTTPWMNAMAQTGLLFRNAWASPLCSPSRAALLTGRYGFRTGVGGLVGSNGPGLDTSEVTVPEMLAASPGGAWTSGAFGKWHLTLPGQGGIAAPAQHGFQHFAGTMGNLIAPQSYFSWNQVVNGVQAPVTGYITTNTIDSALAWIAQQPQSWFAYVALHAPHLPLHAPPPGSYSTDLSQVGLPSAEPVPYGKAMVEALDRELGRLFVSLGAELFDTTVILVGDNGSEPLVVQPPFTSWKSKGSMYEGGLNVPFLVWGRHVAQPGSESQALVHLVDLWPTVAQLAGVAPSAVLPPGRVLDGFSLWPVLQDPAASVRPLVYTEYFQPNHLPGAPAPAVSFWHQAVREARYKLVVSSTLGQGLFDLWVDPFETTNLLAPVGQSLDLVPREERREPAAAEARAALLRLEAHLAEVEAERLSGPR